MKPDPAAAPAAPATPATPAFTEVGREVYVLRYPVLDVNVTLVVGDGEALLVDTLSTDAQARELVRAARAVTSHPWTVVNSHHHFDHCFGNAVVAAGGRPVWGHEEAVALLTDRGAALQRQWYEEWAATEPELAAGLAAVTVVPPGQPVHRTATLTVGGRRVDLRHHGRGHTAGDLSVHVPDADVLVAGDLVEESGPPDFGDAYPLEWPETLAELRHLIGPGTAVVPGHGAVVGRSFVAAQHDQLAALAWLIRDVHADGAAPAEAAEAAAARTGLPLPAAQTAVRRGYAELSGAVP
jgi:glyoxylase-like metal-dependent hydrolase (beta-lactamase superfamily II)